MCIELLELRRERDRALASRTVTGHLTNLLGYCLSVFCIARCCSQLPTVQQGPDPDRRLALIGQHAVKPGKKFRTLYCTRLAFSTAGELDSLSADPGLLLCPLRMPGIMLGYPCRMLFSVKALLFGEDFTTDPVSQAIAFCLRSFSRGHLVENLQMFSQVSPH